MKNLEFKAQVCSLKEYEQKLLTLHPIFLGTEVQTDTYFNVTKGRLKLRESNLKNTLINYYREESAGPKLAEIMLYQYDANVMLKKILSDQLGIKVIVEKERKKYSINNAVFHFDLVDGLGAFIEVEVTDADGTFSLIEMNTIIDNYLQFFGIHKEQLIRASYSDLLLGKNSI
jgi:adenylate cyclase, class 2